MFMYFIFMFVGNWFCPNCQATTNNASHEQDINAEVSNNFTIEVTKDVMKIQDLEDELNKTKIALAEAQEQDSLNKKESYDLTENNQALDLIQKLNNMNFDTKSENEKLQLGLNEANNRIETMQHINETLEIAKTKLETELASAKKALEESKIECVEKTNKIQALRFAKAKFETEVASTQNALDQSKIECVEKTRKIQTLNIAKFRLNTELASTQDALEETRIECVENRSEIQALRIAKNKLETEVTSIQKALEESKAESKKEFEKVENQLKTEAASKKSLEELRQDWAVKVYQSDRKNEDLVNLLSLEPEKLFKKYEQTMKNGES